MSKINWFKNFFRSLIENIFVQIILSLITLGVIVYFKDKLIDFFNYTVTIWQVLILLFVILIIIYSYNFYKSKSVHKFLKYGMEWHVNIKKHAIFKKDVDILVKGPFCPRCLVEMTESNPFQCLSCNTQYKSLNSTNVEEAQRIVKKIIEAELRGGKLLILDWSTLTYSYPNSYLSLKNNGASDAKDVSIEIKLEVDTERRDIGLYKFEKIDSDKIIRDFFNDQKLDPMGKVHDILKELKLINIYHDEIGRYGDENYYYWEWKEIKKEFSCNLELNLSYLLGNQKRIEQSKYLLEFKFRESEPWEVFQDEDNCEIHMHQSQ
ncbi:MAG: hypothetical protein WA144_13545 [Candidatus Methanoperedens sp.]